MLQSLLNYISRISLRWKAIAFISSLLLVVSGVISFYFLRDIQDKLMDRFHTNSKLLADTLARDCRGFLMFKDQSQDRFEELINNVLTTPGVMRVGITDEAGAVLAEKSQEIEGYLPPPAPEIGDFDRTERLAATHSLPENIVGGAGKWGVLAPVFDRNIDVLRGTERKFLGNVYIIFSTERIQSEIQHTLLTGLGLTLAITAVAILAAVFLCEWALTPAVEMARAARQISLGDLSQRVPVRSHDEIGVLAATFNQMAESLDEMTRGLEEKVRQRTEALHRQQEELKEVNCRLERATRHKSEFVANMSHELRTPLNAVIGFSDVLLEKMFGPLTEKQEEYINDILSSGKHLLSLLNDILDLAKVEAGRMELEPSIFDLRQVVEGSLVMVKERATNHSISLSAVISDEIKSVSADERKIKQILFNLLSNAVKFTPDKGAVQINAAIVGDEIQISVSDTGVGIPKSEHERIFEEFHQVSSALSAKAEGTGLGLALCKRFTELHGGRIWVESAPDKGSTFTIALPREKLECGGAAFPLLQTRMAQGFDIRATDTVEVQVLIIESDLSAAEMLAGHLKEAGYTVEVAKNDVEGWEKLKRLSPSAIVVDVANGWSFLNQFRENPATKAVPVIRVFVPDEKSKHEILGADSLAKPVDPTLLVAKLNALGLQPQHAPVRILAIDDDPRTIELLAASLEPVGFEVLRANSGEEGVEMAAQQQPDLIILDLLMPGMNGFEVIEKLEQTPLTQKTPIIIFTIKHLSLEEKQRLKGRIAGLAEKGAFNKDAFVGIVGRVLQRSTKARIAYA